MEKHNRGVASLRPFNGRGQITIFIVVGIIILFLVGFVLLIASEQQKGLRIFREKESEVQQFIGLCLESTAKEAITTIGITGGYIDVPENIRINDRSYFSFAPDTEPKIPLWHYRGQPRIPAKESIEMNISKYIADNINTCLGNFESFKDRFIFQPKRNITAETTIGKTDVSVKLNYPLEMKEKATGAISNAAPVSRTLNVKLGRMHDMAVDILKSENRLNFFENLTIDLLSSSSDFPFTGMDFGCTPKTWKKSQLISFAKDMVYYNIQQVAAQGNRFRFFGSGNVYAMNNFIMPMENTYPDIGAVFFYSRDSRFELHVNPNDVEILRSNMGRSQYKLLKSLCINMYHFTYDIEFPVLATLKDENAFNGEGFVFNFAFPVTINHNKGDKKEFSRAVFESPTIDYDFCSDVSDSVVDIRVADAYTFEEIYNADLEYKCVKYLCELGSTTADAGIYRLRAKLPAACTNGLLTARKEGYLEGTAVYEGGDYIEVPVKPLRKLRVDFVKHDSDNFARAEELQPGETVALTVTGITEPNIEQFYSSDSAVNEIELVEGNEKYHIEAILMQDNERIIGGYIGDAELNYKDMADKSKITLHLLQYMPIAVTEEQQQAAAAYLFEDKSYQEALKPTFS